LEKGSTTQSGARRRRVVIILAVCVSLGISVVAFWPEDKEPEYNGRKLTEWLIFRGTAKSEDQVRVAEDAVRHIGTNGLPCLIKWMSYQPPAWKQKMLHWQIFNVVPAPFGYRFFRQEIQSLWVLDGFMILAPTTSEVIPELTRVVDRWPNSCWERALVTMGRLGTNGFVALYEIATNQTRVAEVRCEAMGELGSEIGRKQYRSVTEWQADRTFVPGLVQCLQERDVAWGAARALGRARLAPEDVVPALTNAMRFTDMRTRVFVVEALGRFHQEARSAIPVLITALSDSDYRVHLAVTNALSKIAPEVLTNGVKDF